MPKDYFNISNTTSLSSLAAKSRVHIIGVAGVAMAQLALALSKKGYLVSGSDSDFWEPMGSLLRSSSVELRAGYDGSHIPEDAALVVIGNAIRYGNPEVEAIEKIGLPYSLFPKVLYELGIFGRHSIVVAGTHGKTTTTALGAYTLRGAEEDPSWFFGGAAPQFEQSLSVGEGRFAIVEGDEYDSAFFAKIPKFSFYYPQTLIVTSIEYDHADIYPDLESIKAEFTKLVASMPTGSKVLACGEMPVIRELLPAWRQASKASIFTYGTKGSDFNMERRPTTGGQQHLRVRCQRGEFAFELAIGGEYNALNATAIFAACLENGVDVAHAAKSIASFEGVKRRQEIRWNGPVVIIEDFAHHPTAVRETLKGIREQYSDRRIIAVFDPRSNTSRRRIFQDAYAEALGVADIVLVTAVVQRHNDAGVELLSPEELAETLTGKGVESLSLPDYEAVPDAALKIAAKGDVFVIMSNGSFGGVIPQIESALRERFEP